MSEILNVLTRKTSLRKACKELSLAEMEKLSENLLELIEERKEEEAARLEEEREKREKLEQIKREMAESGIDIGELMESLEGAAPKKRTKGTVKPKYQITDSEGKVHQWTGRGRTPKVFQKFFDEGGSKEECLIG
ncbi:H-NS family nucleoid-associated regulatory protein [Motiliproteus sp. SC1-56]|uniref:H-NS histone family protein n=1 Tax=Motiliproteus sp. SC1-56 TaxID=2799565 RepID=UPI001A8ED46F|nr:H-NS histone family protein [Motiliproteus sp. SC1-56]